MSDEQTNQNEVMQPLEFITTESGNQLYMAGPLAEAYAEGLDQLYAKHPSEGGVALENQAVDIGLLRRNFLVSKKPLLDAANKANMSLFYGVQRSQVQVKHIVDVVDALAQMSDTQRASSAVIVDALVQPRSGHADAVQRKVCLEAQETLARALEAYCQARQVPVYASFDEFLQKHC